MWDIRMAKKMVRFEAKEVNEEMFKKAVFSGQNCHYMYSFMRNSQDIQIWDLYQSKLKHTVNLNETVDDILIFPKI